MLLLFSSTFNSSTVLSYCLFLIRIYHYFYLCSSIGKINQSINQYMYIRFYFWQTVKDMQIKYDMPSSIFLLFFLLCVPWTSWICLFLTLIFKVSRDDYFIYFFLLHSLLLHSLVSQVYAYCPLKLYYCSWMFSSVFFWFFILFVYKCEKFPLAYLKAHWFLLCCV